MSNGLRSRWPAIAKGSHFNFKVYMLGLTGVATLLSLPRDDIDACIMAYEFMVSGTSDIAARAGDVDVETDHVRAYYAVANEVLAIADIEKMPVAKASVAT